VEDAWAAHYDRAGNQLWIRQLGTAQLDAVGCAAPDGAGGVCLGGKTAGSLGGPSAGGFYVAGSTGGSPSGTGLTDALHFTICP